MREEVALAVVLFTVAVVIIWLVDSANDE
jgi:hypothetical protein